MIDMFLEIGFELVGQEDTEVGYVRDYKYYPSYMGDNHYTLVRFTYRKGGDNDWRLYIHKNSDGSYVDSLFQITDYLEWNKVLIKKYFDRIFFIEIRDKKLEELGI